MVGVVDNKNYPLVTFALIAYNQEKYVADAIAAAFSQTYSHLEIILSDDCSSDGTFEVMRHAVEEYRGPHRVVLNRNPINLNIGGHVNVIADLATAEFIVLAAGDDVSIPFRTEKLVQQWNALGRPPAVLFSDFEPIDGESKVVTLNGEKLYRGPFLLDNMARGEIRVLGATTAITKNVFSLFPPLNSDVRYEDKILPFRALLLGGVVVLIEEKLVKYRIDGGISRVHLKSGRDYLYRIIPNFLERTLPDAVQRLMDLIFISPENFKLNKECERTIFNLKALIALIGVKGWFGLEICLLEWMLSGARPFALIKLYLKLRFVIIYDLYFKFLIKNKK